MIIAGLQKLSLVDFPGKVACTVFMGGCNLRCPYCHNSELLVNPPALMQEDDFFKFLSKRKGLLDGVCVSGGEPCLNIYGSGDTSKGYMDLREFFRKIREMGFKTKLDTNGCFPSVLDEILKDGYLDYVAMDIKNSPAKYTKTAGLSLETAETAEMADKSSGIVGKVLESIGLLMEYKELTPGFDFEFRTTVAEPLHDEASFTGIRDMLLPFVNKKGHKIPAYYLQGFVDRDTVFYSGLNTPSHDTLSKYLQILSSISERVEIRGE